MNRVTLTSPRVAAYYDVAEISIRYRARTHTGSGQFYTGDSQCIVAADSHCRSKTRAGRTWLPSDE
jgi:hypothetical protein